VIVTIDGPAGSGKSTAARKLAARLEIAYLDTGAMYRAIALAVLQQGASFQDSEVLWRLARESKLSLDCGPTFSRVRLNGHDVSEAIRSMAVSQVTSFVAKHPGVRRHLVDEQRRIGAELASFVSEGRDQGSVVFPHADAKFVLDADLQKRAQRRFQELSADGEDVTLADVMENLRSRDEADSRQWEPLLTQDSVTVIDTTRMTIVEVVDRLAQVISAVRKGNAKPMHPS
jgi:cytidylate kinase